LPRFCHGHRACQAPGDPGRSRRDHAGPELGDRDAALQTPRRSTPGSAGPRSRGDTRSAAFGSLIDRWLFSLEEEIIDAGAVKPDAPDAFGAAVGELMERRLADLSLTQRQYAAVLRALLRSADAHVGASPSSRSASLRASSRRSSRRS
jgi:hypothetical protein